MGDSSLSNYIIHGKVADVKVAVLHAENLNEIDEYGYTPLIQCAIVNSIEKAVVLLKAGADVNFTDLTDRTALHWATDNNNIKLAKLLIQHGAEVNAYTRAGQSTLVMPLLREQRALRKLLIKHGADLEFAKDFINSKTLGHQFELEGRIDIVTHDNTFIEMELEGFYLEFTLALLANSLRDFIKNYAGKHIKPYFKNLRTIIHALEHSTELLKFQHYLIDESSYASHIDKLLDQEPLIIPVSYAGHGITIVQLGEWFIRCDRGEYGVKNGTVIVYRIGQPHNYNRRFIKNLLYRRQDKAFIDEGLVEMLDLHILMRLPLSPQLTGNCTWSNVEASVVATLFLLLLNATRAQSENDINNCHQQAMYVFNEWLNWDKRRALYFCLESMKHATPARKAAKAATLAAILFQHFSYEKPFDWKLAKMMMHVLAQPEYHYIIKAYLEAFKKDKKNPHVKNLKLFLDNFGIKGLQ